eukprot:c19904_g3_i1.p1 GENE.c19904_g3_i1~~c19904_g3_i1.p1  ORF type:complete len:1168 (+),score=239.78 c19904_g3_i1:138-3506(+)
MKPACFECLLDVLEGVGPKPVIEKVSKLASTHKSPKVYEESLLWLKLASITFGPVNVSLKDALAFCKLGVANSNPKVKAAAIECLGVFQGYIGPSFRNFVSELATDKIDAIAKAVPADLPDPSTWRIPKGGEAPAPIPAGKGAASGGMVHVEASSVLKRIDLNQAIPPQILTELGDRNWEKRQHGLEEIDKILRQSNNCIEPDTGNLFNALKACLGDANKNIAVMAMNLVATILDALGPHALKQGRMIVAELPPLLSEKKQNVLDAVVGVYDSYLRNTSPKEMVVYLSKAMDVKNPEGRVAILEFINKAYGPVDPPIDLKLLADPLVAYLSDRNSQVRSVAEVTLMIVVRSIGTKAFRSVCSRSNVKPAVMNTINELLNKIVQDLNGLDGGAVDNTQTSRQKAAEPESQVSRTTSSPMKPPQAPSASARSDASRAPQAVSKTQVTPTKTPAKSSARSASSTGRETVPSPTTNASDDRLFTSNAAQKQKRVSSDRGGWRYTTDDKLPASLVADLRTNCESSIHPRLASRMFSTDVRDTLEAFDIIFEYLESPILDIGLVVNSLDMLLRWLALQLLSPNATVLAKLVDTLFVLMKRLNESQYELTPHEAGSFLPFLCNKLGHSKENVRDSLRDVLMLFTSVYPADAVFQDLVTSTASKSPKTRNECIDACTEIIQSFGIEAIQSMRLVTILASQVQDTIVRASVQKFMEILASKMPEEKYERVLAGLSQADRAFFEISSSPATEPQASKSQARPNLLNDSLLRIPIQEQITTVFESLKNPSVPVNDKIGYLRHLSALLSSENNSTFAAPGALDDIVSKLMVELQNVFASDSFDTRYCKYIIFALMTVMEAKLAAHLTLEVVTVVVHEMLMLTIIFSNESSEEIKLLVRALNATIVSFSENANPTVSICIMLRLLYCSPMDEETRSDQILVETYQSLAARLMLKQVKQLSQLMDTLDLDTLLIEVHQFLLNYTAPKPQSPDLPSRLVKTIVSTVVRAKGEEVNEILERHAEVIGEDSTLAHLVAILQQREYGDTTTAWKSNTTMESTTQSSNNDALDRLRDVRARIRAQSNNAVPTEPSPSASLRSLREKLQEVAPPMAREDSVPGSSLYNLKQRLNQLKANGGQ